jgi:hypothetical protein
MDLSSGSLNYAAIEILRAIENLVGNKWFRGIIPSPTTIRKAAKKVEAKADEIGLKTRKLLTPQGEGVEFLDKGKVIQLIHDAYGLTDVGKERPLEVAITTDGSMLCHLVNLVMVGYKMVDPAARHPLTGKRLLDPTDPKSIFQSRDLCFPLLLMLGQETKEMYSENIKPVYDLFFSASTEGETNVIAPECLPFVCSCPGDLSCHWKATKKGKGAKAGIRFCMNCACTSDNIAAPQVTCGECKKKGPDTEFGQKWKADYGVEWQCYHHVFANNTYVEKCKESMEEMIVEHKVELEKVEKSKLKLAGSIATQQEASADPNSIEYSPVTVGEAAGFSALLEKECLMRGISLFDVDEDERRDELRNHLSVENEIRNLQKDVEHLEEKDGSLYSTKCAIPCILHMENRSNLKAMTMLFIDGLSNAQGAMLPDTFGIVSMEKKETIFIGTIEEVMNSSILGDEFNRAFWRLPIEKEQGSATRKIGIVSLSNGRSRKVLNHFNDIIDLCIVDSEKNPMWKKAWGHYRTAMEILRKKGVKYTTEEEDAFQNEIDMFFQLWVNLHQHEGVTNYIHMLGAGHVKEYMREWGNLNKFSQQGWESLNALIKAFFFRRTNRGGGNQNEKSKLVPIAKLLQRRLMWLCDLTGDMFTDYASLTDDDVPSDTTATTTELIDTDSSDIH